MTTTAPAHWLQHLPQLPLEQGTPICKVNADGETWADHAIALTPANCPALAFVPEPDAETIVIDLAHWRVDLDADAGFAYGLRLLMRRTANEDRAAREWPEALETAHAFWQDYGIVTGAQVTDANRRRLALALREVFGG